MATMSKEYILEHGYKEYKPTPFDNDGVETCYQKCIKDDMGKLYFIDIKQWKAWQHPYTGQKVDIGYEYSVQMYAKDTHDAIDLLFHSTWTLERVEEYLEKAFETGMYDYYEKYQET